MSTFTAAEVEYLTGQPLGRFPPSAPAAEHTSYQWACSTTRRPTPLSSGSKKFRDARRHPQVAIVVDDLAAVEPWTPRGIEIRGSAETFTEGGAEAGNRVGASFPFEPAWIRVRPRRVLAWGIDGGSYELTARDVA